MANGGGPPEGGQYPQQGGGYPPQQGAGYPPQGQYQAGYGGGPLSPQGRPLASWGKRVGAAIIDALVIAIPSYLLMAIIGVGAASGVETDPVTGEITSGGGGFIATMLISVALIAAIAIAYQVYFNGNERGQTLGKMALGIQVRDEATGGPIGYGKAFLRWLVTWALGFLCGIGQIIDLLFPLWDDKRQTLHDKAVSSLVIDLKP